MTHASVDRHRPRGARRPDPAQRRHRDGRGPGRGPGPGPGMSEPDERAPDARFTLANERTLLAYQRSAIGLMAAAIAVAHFFGDDARGPAPGAGPAGHRGVRRRGRLPPLPPGRRRAPPGPHRSRAAPRRTWSAWRCCCAWSSRPSTSSRRPAEPCQRPRRCCASTSAPPSPRPHSSTARPASSWRPPTTARRSPTRPRRRARRRRRVPGELARRHPAAADAEVLACSSAGGGLRIAVVGNEELVTAEAGRRVALSSGGKVVAVLGRRARTTGKLAALREARPDVLLLVGGTDGGNAEGLVDGRAVPRGERWRGPVVVAGQRRGAERGRRLETLAGRRTSWPTTWCRGSACSRRSSARARSARCSSPT